MKCAQNTGIDESVIDENKIKVFHPSFNYYMHNSFFFFQKWNIKESEQDQNNTEVTLSLVSRSSVLLFAGIFPLFAEASRNEPLKFNIVRNYRLNSRFTEFFIFPQLSSTKHRYIHNLAFCLSAQSTCFAPTLKFRQISVCSTLQHVVKWTSDIVLDK